MKHKGQPPQSSHCGEKGEWEGKERSERSGRKKKEGEEAPASPRSSRHGEPTFNAGPNSSFLPRRSGLSSLFPACSRAPQAQQPGRPPPSLPWAAALRSGGRRLLPGPSAPGRLQRALPGPGLTFAQLPLPHADDERRVLAVVDEPQAQGLHALLRVAQLRQLPLQRHLRERRHRCAALSPAAPSRPGWAAFSPRLSAPTREEPTSDCQPFSSRRQRPAPTKWRRPRPWGAARSRPLPRLPSLPAQREPGAGSLRAGASRGWGQASSIVPWERHKNANARKSPPH